MADNIIQLDFSEVDDKWWLRCSIWAQMAYIDTLSRPTEDEALQNIYKKTRALSRANWRVELSTKHLEALRLEYHSLTTRPFDDTPERYVADRMHLSRQDAAALLEDASVIISARELLGLSPQIVHLGSGKKLKRAA